MNDAPPRKSFQLLSMETLFALFGLFSLFSGVWQGEIIPIFWGVTILIGLGILVLVRRRDWKQHWTAMDQSRGNGPDAGQP